MGVVKGAFGNVGNKCLMIRRETAKMMIQPDAREIGMV